MANCPVEQLGSLVRRYGRAERGGQVRVPPSATIAARYSTWAACHALTFPRAATSTRTVSITMPFTNEMASIFAPAGASTSASMDRELLSTLFVPTAGMPA